jgi:hypothetical protein
VRADREILRRGMSQENVEIVRRIFHEATARLTFPRELFAGVLQGYEASHGRPQVASRQRRVGIV